MVHYNVLLALRRDMVGSNSLVPEGLYKVLCWFYDMMTLLSQTCIKSLMC